MTETFAGRFEFCPLPRIVFGPGQFSRIGELAAPLGRRALAVVNGCEPGGGGPADRLADLLADAGLHVDFFRQRGEPTVADVDAAVAEARAAGSDLVVGLGGGSAIDTAKAAAALLANGGATLDYMEIIGGGRKLARPAAPWIAVPTTAGAGAEVTRNAVVASPEHRRKASIRSEHTVATVALVDPALGHDVPPAVTAAAGMDALCQLVESYTSTGAGPLTDPLAVEGMGLAARWLRAVFADGRNAAAREGMALAALLGGITLANAGLGAAHGLAGPLGGAHPVPHGVACATLLAPVMAANVAALRADGDGRPALARYADVGRALTGRGALADDDAIDAGIAFVGELVDDLKIPRLASFGLTDAQVADLARQARASASMQFNPVSLPEETLARIVREA